MELKHYLEYLQNTIVNKWESLAMKDLDGNTISFDKVATSTYGSDECFYGRRTDYKDFYEIAKKYLSMCVENPGPQIAMQTTDPRATSDAGQ